MNLVDGVLITQEEADRLLDALEGKIARTMAGRALLPRMVMDACEKLVTSLAEREYLALMGELGIGGELAKGYLDQAKVLFGREYLSARMTRELGDSSGGLGRTRNYLPAMGEFRVTERVMPLGVLLHIPAGNADGLPAFSVLEGLLTGNINILKLPEVDNGISVKILSELIRLEPVLSEYIYVFDYSSKDVESISKLLDVADGVVIWGGDMAVAALRKMVRPNTKLIEWGHKLSFAYVTPGGINEEGLAAIAGNMCMTNQLLCNSCQGIYLDTASMQEVYRFCDKFLPYLDQARTRYAQEWDMATQSQVTLKLYHESLETAYRGSTLFWTDNCTVAAYPDAKLEPAVQFGNCWVKPLPRERILETLRPYKNHLQSAALLCHGGERRTIRELLWKAGVVRVTPPEGTNGTYCGMPHDGEYPLRRYVKTACDLGGEGVPG